MDDHIEAFHRDVRRQARQYRWAADEVASGNTPTPKPGAAPASTAPPATGTPYAAQSLTGLPPRGGPVRLRR
jgi:hypothetical protein